MRIMFIIHDIIMEPLGVTYLSSVLKRAGHQTRLVAITQGDLFDVVDAFKPELLGYSLSTGYEQRFFDINLELKKRYNALSVFGGAHPTFFPEMIEQPGVDAVCLGEGELALAEFVEALDDGKLPTDVANFWVKDNGTIHRNPVRPLVEDLDTIPFPDREIFCHYAGKHQIKTMFMIATRGCPYDCSYCFNHAYRELYAGKGKAVRSRSVENVIQEALELKQRYRPEIILFQDDTFILSQDWVLEFSKEYKDRVGIPFHCHFRANLVTEEIAGALHDAGCISIKMAIECIDDHVRNDILRRNLSFEELDRACAIVKKSGIKLVTQNILGTPGSSLDIDLATLRFSMKHRPSYAYATLLQAYPKTWICDYAKKHGYLEQDAEDYPASFFDRSMLNIPDKRKIERLRTLFALAVEFHFLYPLLRFLVRLPIEHISTLLDKLWRGYCIRHRIFPYSITIREYFHTIKVFLKTRWY